MTKLPLGSMVIAIAMQVEVTGSAISTEHLELSQRRAFTVYTASARYRHCPAGPGSSLPRRSRCVRVQIISRDLRGHQLTHSGTRQTLRVIIKRSDDRIPFAPTFGYYNHFNLWITLTHIVRNIKGVFSQ